MILAHFVAAFVCVIAGVYGLTVSDRRSTSFSGVVFLILGAGQMSFLISEDTHTKPLFSLDSYAMFAIVAVCAVTAVIGGIVWYSRNTKTSVAVEQ